MNIPRINFRSLLYLQEVARCGSFTEAAWELGISQPALSHSLGELSKRLGVSLFRKQGRRRVLTEAGERVARYADQVIGQTADMLRWLESWESGEVGSLRVGMIDTASLYTLPAGLSLLREEYPEIDLQLMISDSAELLSMLDRYQLDLAVVVGPVGTRYNSRLITTERMHVYSRPPETNRPDKDEMAPEGWALYPPGSQTRGLIDSGLSQLGIHPHIALESGHPRVLRQMAVLGYAKTVLPRQVAEPEGDNSDLCKGPEVAQRRIEATWRADTELDPRAGRLLDLVKRERVGETQSVRG